MGSLHYKIMSVFLRVFLKILNQIKKNDSGNLANKFYQDSISVAKKLLENPQKTISSKIKIQGNINASDIDVFTVMIYLLKHAFIQSLMPQIDQKISMKDIVYQSTVSSK